MNIITTLERLSNTDGLSIVVWSKVIHHVGRVGGEVSLEEIFQAAGFQGAIHCLRAFDYYQYRPWVLELCQIMLDYHMDRGGHQAVKLAEVMEYMRNPGVVMTSEAWHMSFKAARVARYHQSINDDDGKIPAMIISKAVWMMADHQRSSSLNDELVVLAMKLVDESELAEKLASLINRG